MKPSPNVNDFISNPSREANSHSPLLPPTKSLSSPPNIAVGRVDYFPSSGFRAGCCRPHGPWPRWPCEVREIPPFPTTSSPSAPHAVSCMLVRSEVNSSYTMSIGVVEHRENRRNANKERSSQTHHRPHPLPSSSRRSLRHQQPSQRELPDTPRSPWRPREASKRGPPP